MARISLDSKLVHQLISIDVIHLFALLTTNSNQLKQL